MSHHCSQRAHNQILQNEYIMIFDDFYQITFRLIQKTPCVLTEMHKSWRDTDGAVVVQLCEICLDFMLSQADGLMALTTRSCPLFSSHSPSSCLSCHDSFFLPFSREAREEREQVSHAGVWWDRPCDWSLSPPPQPVWLSPQGQDSPREWV